MKKTFLLLMGLVLMTTAFQSCQKKTLTVMHRTKYTDYDYYNRTRPYYDYDSIVFSDGSTAVSKTAHAPMNSEIVIKDSKGRNIAIISSGSEAVPVYQFLRYDADDRMKELLEFNPDVNNRTPFCPSWIDEDTGKHDLVALRNTLEECTIDRLPEYAEPVLYKFIYGTDGRLAFVSSSRGEEIESATGHHLVAEFVYEPGFWASDLSGSSHKLYITELPDTPRAADCVMRKYNCLTSIYEITRKSGQLKQLKIYGINPDDENECIETIDVTYRPDCHVYSHEYANTTSKVCEYWKNNRKTRLEKYDESGTLTEVYCYEYPSEGIVLMHTKLWDPHLCRMVRQTPQRMKVWDDLFESGRLSGMDYAESVYKQYIW